MPLRIGVFPFRAQMSYGPNVILPRHLGPALVVLLLPNCFLCRGRLPLLRWFQREVLFVGFLLDSYQPFHLPTPRAYGSPPHRVASFLLLLLCVPGSAHGFSYDLVESLSYCVASSALYSLCATMVVLVEVGTPQARQMAIPLLKFQIHTPQYWSPTSELVLKIGKSVCRPSKAKMDKPPSLGRQGNDMWPC